MTRLLVRADASPEIGVGHVARVVAIAEAAVERGWTLTFAGRTDNADWLAARLDDLGVTRRAPADGPALGALAAELAADAVLVDHYGLGELRADINRAGARLVSYEDDSFGRRDADIVVDCGFAPASRQHPGRPDALLRGPAYAPIRRAIRDARDRRAERAPWPGPPRVLVVLGGGGTWAATGSALLRALRDTGRPVEVRMLARGSVVCPDPLSGQSFRVDPPGTDLPDRLVDTDLAVSAAGVTLLELCCTGVPTATLPLVDNQETGYRAALDLGLAAGLGHADELGRDTAAATRVLRELLDDGSRRERIATVAAATIDGRGAERVLDAVAAHVAAGPVRH